MLEDLRDLAVSDDFFSTLSDYKDDGTNILLDANENAYGPGIAATIREKLNDDNGRSGVSDIDFLGLHRYPDP